MDIGCGCGAWVRCLACHAGPAFKELALADSSRVALKVAARENDGRSRYQVDLLDLQWRDRWDMAFMLDVLEHVADDAEALQQVAVSLRPGGMLFVTVPALGRFSWWNRLKTTKTVATVAYGGRR